MVQPRPHTGWRGNWTTTNQKTSCKQTNFDTLPKTCQNCRLNMCPTNVFCWRCWTSPLPGTGCCSCSGWLQKYLFVSLDTRTFPFLYFLILKINPPAKHQPHTQWCWGTDGTGVCQHQCPHHCAQCHEAHPAQAQVCTQVVGYRTGRGWGTQLKHQRWSQPFVKEAEKVQPALQALQLSFPSRRTSTCLPDLPGSAPATSDPHQPSAGRLLGEQRTGSSPSTSEICRGTMGPLRELAHGSKGQDTHLCSIHLSPKLVTGCLQPCGSPTARAACGAGSLREDTAL